MEFFQPVLKSLPVAHHTILATVNLGNTVPTTSPLEPSSNVQSASGNAYRPALRSSRYVVPRAPRRKGDLTE